MPVPLEGRSLDDVLEDAPDVPVKVRFRERPVPDGRDDPFNLNGVARLHKVIACPDRGRSIILVAPVSHYHPVKPPFVPEEPGKKVRALLGILTVQFIVGRHHSPRRRLLHGYLEILEIDLPQCPFPDQRVVLVAVGLLVVEREMLDRGPDAVGLHSPDIRSGHFSGEQRILGEILVVTSVERIAVYVLARGQEHVHPVFESLVADGGGSLLDKRKVPGRSQEGSYRKSRGIESIARAFPGGIDAKAGRAVREDSCRDSEPLYLSGGAGCAADKVGNAGGNAAGGDCPSSANAQRGLLFERHGLDDLVNIVGRKFGLCSHSGRQRHHNGYSEEHHRAPEANQSHMNSFFCEDNDSSLVIID